MPKKYLFPYRLPFSEASTIMFRFISKFILSRNKCQVCGDFTTLHLTPPSILHLHLRHLTSISSPSLRCPLSFQSLLGALHCHLSNMNLVISHILQLHHLPVRKGVGHARRSWHQPVIPPFLLPPSVSLLNQIISLTHAHATPFLNQLLCLSFCSFIPSSLNPSQSSELHNILAADWLRETCMRIAFINNNAQHIGTLAWVAFLKILIKFPSTLLLPSCVCLPTLQTYTQFGHMERHLVPHHPTHMDTKNLTAWWVNLERCQGSSYAPAKCHRASQVPVRLRAHPHHCVTHTCMHTHWQFQPPAALSGDKETEGSCLAGLLPAPNTYCTIPELIEEAVLYVYTLSACLLGL